MKQLVDLVNHGILPFVGRAAEIARITEFWRETLTAQGLRATLVVGEAGVGKSRLAGHLERSISDVGGTVIHARLYPESLSSPASILATALGASNQEHHLLAGEPAPAVPDVTGAFRRICRLRPTLLIIEDVHLLSGDALREFAQILETLSDETLSLVAFARPLELPVRGLLQRWLVAEWPLEGLPTDALGDLWQTLYGATPDGATLEALTATTHGNPLALRTVLRTLLPIDAGPTAGVTPEVLQGSLTTNVGLLSEGMVAHLDEEERRWGCTLATLGELFSRSAAVPLLDDPEIPLERLLFRGVIARSPIGARPLGGRGGGEEVYSFTHSLLHRHLADNATPDLLRLASVVIEGIPLYSIFPLQLLRDNAEAIELDPERLSLFVEKALGIALALDGTSDWQLGEEAFATAEAIVRAHRSTWEEGEGNRIELTLLARRILMMRRKLYTPEYFALVGEFLALTEAKASDPRFAELRLHALRFAHVSGYLHRSPFNDPLILQRLSDQVAAHIEAHPALRKGSTYVGYISAMLQATASMSDRPLLRRLEEECLALLADENLSSELRETLRGQALPFLFMDFNNEEELSQRLELLAELEADPPRDQTFFQLRRIRFLQSLGRIEAVLNSIDFVIPWFQGLGMYRNVASTRLAEIEALAALGLEINETMRRIEAILLLVIPTDVPVFRDFLLVRILETAFLRDEAESGLASIDRLFETDVDAAVLQGNVVDIEHHITLAFLRNDFDAVISLAEDASIDPPVVALAAQLRSANPSDAEACCTEVRERLNVPLLTFWQINGRRIALAMLERIDMEGWKEKDRKEMEFIIRKGLKAELEWLADRGMTGFMWPLVERYGSALNKKDITAWRSRITSLEKIYHDRLPRADTSQKIRLVMFGSIGVIPPSGETVPIRGARLAAVAALMAADRMTSEPLGAREFRHIAAGGEEDQEHARKTMNAAIFRLREFFGDDGILTDGETPQINLDRVDVDILEANNHLLDVADALRNRSLLRARTSLLAALDIVRGEVPFPSLYDDYFEATREDLEFRTRDAILNVARGLLREKDTTSAETILRRGATAIPDDEEIIEMLCDVLGTIGKGSEAERIRLRMALAADE